eukprot:g7269.t1
MALEHSWFAQCESIQKAHRSQKKNMSLTTARAAEFWERLRQTSAMTCLRRLFHSVRNVRRIQGLMIPGPEEDNGDPETNARAAADAMCAEAFEWLLYTSGATAAGGIPLRKLNSMIQSVIQSEKSNIPRHELEMLKVASTPSCPSPCSEGAATPCSPVEMRPPIFCFTLRRADEVPLGMNVALNRRQEVVVESISPWTALDSWNKFQVQGPQDRSVYPGDRIVSVNGFMAPALMLQECQTKLLLKMEVMRAGGLLELQPLPLSELV